MFPKAKKAKIDLVEIGGELETAKQELMPEGKKPAKPRAVSKKSRS